MKNKINKLLIAGALTFSAQAVIAEEVVNVLNWSDYIDEQVNEDFTAATGIKVVYDVFDSNEVLEAKLLSWWLRIRCCSAIKQFLSTTNSSWCFSKT